MSGYLVECEYDRPSDQLISMAIVPIGLGQTQPPERYEFYQAMQITTQYMDSWVVENVLPVRNIETVEFPEFVSRLTEYIIRRCASRLTFTSMDGLSHFANVLAKASGRGLAIPGPLHLRYRPGIISATEIPHNALEDARGAAHAIRHADRLKNYNALAH